MENNDRGAGITENPVIDTTTGLGDEKMKYIFGASIVLLIGIGVFYLYQKSDTSENPSTVFGRGVWESS